MAEFKLNLVRPEPGTGDRTRNQVVETVAAELCEACVPVLWGNVQKVIAANLSGQDVVPVPAKPGS